MEKPNKSILRLRKALVGLLQTKGLQDIQVKHLVEEAQISRATFYLHYSSKEEVLVDYIDAMFDTFFVEIEASLNQTTTIDESIAKKMFETFERNGDFSRVLLQEAIQPVLVKRFKGYLARIVGHVTLNNKRFDVPDDQLSYLVDYWAGGSLLMIRRWVAEDFKPGVDEMASLYAKLTISGMKALLNDT